MTNPLGATALSASEEAIAGTYVSSSGDASPGAR